jgi:hypothetical protein
LREPISICYRQIVFKIAALKNVKFLAIISGCLLMLKLIYYVPESHLESTKLAIFEAGAGGVGNYEHCAWQVLGTGQFKPVKGANPFIGELDTLEQLPEWRVETIVTEEKAKAVAKALKANHPYEEPAFEFIQIIDVEI